MRFLADLPAAGLAAALAAFLAAVVLVRRRRARLAGPVRSRAGARVADMRDLLAGPGAGPDGPWPLPEPGWTETGATPDGLAAGRSYAFDPALAASDREAGRSPGSIAGAG